MASVYEETAGLMVNDPVLRTHKVALPSFSFCIGLGRVCLIVLANKYNIGVSAFISGVGTWNIGKYF